MRLDVSTVLVYIGFYLFIVFLSLGIACALYYLAELIEEFLRTTKRLIDYTIKATVVANGLLIIDGLPFYCILSGLMAHGLYYRLLHRSRFPYISLESPDALMAMGGFICNTGAWVFYYWHSRYTTEYIAAFLLITTWLVPFTLSLSLAGEQTSLPGAGGYPYSVSTQFGSPGHSYSHSDSGASSGGKQRRGLALRIFELLRMKRDEVIPEMMSKLPLEPALMPKEKI
eukprot:jgi/Picsp_1/5396/NSC_02756-R1_protein